MQIDDGDAEERVPLGAMSADREERNSPRESKRLRKGKGKARGDSGSGSGKYSPPLEDENRGQVVFALGDDEDESRR